MTCYKEEIENMQKMEAHLTVENYQKLVNDFNQLYDHYKMHKYMSKKTEDRTFSKQPQRKNFPQTSQENR